MREPALGQRMWEDQFARRERASFFVGPYAKRPSENM